MATRWQGPSSSVHAKAVEDWQTGEFMSESNPALEPTDWMK